MTKLWVSGVGAGSTPALMCVLSDLTLAVLFMYLVVGLQIYFQSNGVDMGTLHYRVIVFSCLKLCYGAGH